MMKKEVLADKMRKDPTINSLECQRLKRLGSKKASEISKERKNDR